MTPRLYTLPDGRTLSQSQLAVALGLRRGTLREWLKTMPLEAILTRRPRRAVLTLPDGRQVTQAAYARELGITDGALFQRRHAWPLERITAPGRQPPQQLGRPRKDESRLIYCRAHTCVYARTLHGWAWEPMQPGILSRAKEYAKQFGYALRLVEKACPQCIAQEIAA
jgi:transposase-like protein